MLLPEVAVHLIMEDLSQDRATAIDTMLRSMKYGDTRFVLEPEDELEYDTSILQACCNKPRFESSGSYTTGENDATNGVGKRTRRGRATAIEMSACDAAKVDVGACLEDGPERKRRKVSIG